jgi:hypothetical protein
MNRLLNFGIVVFLVCGHVVRGANPDDVKFRARLTKDTNTYHMGEPIEIEISYSTQTEKKYSGSFTGPSPDLDLVTPHVTPLDGVLDLRELRRGRGTAGSILSGLGYLSSQPVTQQLDLCEWFRFRKPGYYSVTITTTEVSRVRGANEGGGQEPLTLESNSVDFYVLPPDPAWDAVEVSNIEHELNQSTNTGERGQTLRCLARLDTPASVEMLVRLYLANTDGGQDWIFDSGLHESSQTDLIISLLSSALSDPTTKIPAGLPVLLADLQTRKELGVVPAYPSDPVNQQKWTEEWKARSRVHDSYLAKANALLMASVKRRSGPERATAIYQEWYDATQLSATNPLAPEVLSRLESDVLGVASDLDHVRQVQFAVLAWQTMPHEQLLPMVRSLAKDSLNHPAGYDNHEPIRLWCEGYPEECDAAILQAVVETDNQIDKNIVLMLSEAERPELDKMLEAHLREPATGQDAFRSQRLAALVLRAGSRNIAGAVDLFLDQAAAKGGCDGESQGDLLGFLFRVAPEDGARRLSTALQEKNNPCGSYVLRTLHNVRPSDDIIPIVVRALDSPNFIVAQSAALYLGQHGPASTEDALWRRLEALWRAWQDRSAELPNEMMPRDSDIKSQTAMLERALASALSHAANWNLSPADLDRLRFGCLTKSCRDIAEGKVFLNL